MNYLITDFGAINDGNTLCTEAIQSAIDTCFENGGGYVQIPSGRFVTGTIELKDNVYLLLEPGAFLLASKSIKDFRSTKRGSPWATSRAQKFPTIIHFPVMILAENAQNIGIVGSGTIDGRRWIDGTLSEEEGRLFLVSFSYCKNVCIRDVTMTNPGNFVNYLLCCEDVLIRGLRIYSEKTPCGDGIDFDGGKNVVISDCIIHAGDDGISLKSLVPDEPCENFMISNCYISAEYWGCIRIGPESTADMRNITITNCVFEESNDGIKIQMTEDSVFEDFVISNISMRRVVRPIYMTNNCFPMSKLSSSIRPIGGIIRRVKFSNITALMYQKPASQPRAWHKSCCYLYSLPCNTVEDITLRDITLVPIGGVDSSENDRGDHGEMIDYIEFYPELSLEVGVFPATAMYLKNLKRVTMDNVFIDSAAKDGRSAICAENIENLTVRELSERNCNGILRHYACTNMRVIDCQGEVSTLNEKARNQWEENRNTYNILEKQYADEADIIDASEKLEVLMHTKNSAFETPVLEKGKKYYLYFPFFEGDFAVIINGNKILERRIPEKYTAKSIYACEISDYITDSPLKIEIINVDAQKPFNPLWDIEIRG